MKAVIGLGSNLGDRIGMLRAAVSRLPGVVARSSVWETAPVGPPQPDYLNAAVLCSVEHLEPLELFDQMLAIERALGRVRTEKWGPRTIDLDLLFLPGRTFSHERLVVPHPHLLERAFALLPLLEVLPDADLPVPVDLDRSGVRKTDLSLSKQ